MPEFVSWADTERDTTAWLGNPLQDASIETLYQLEDEVLATDNLEIIALWRRLQTSDHFYYMCIKWFQDGDVHKYFSPYSSPYDAFLFYSNALHQIRFMVDRSKKERLAASQHGGDGSSKRGVIGAESRVQASRRKPARSPKVVVT